MERGKVTAKEVAKWFIMRAGKDAENNCGDYLTQLKLQKLMYYAKGFFYVFENEKLYDSFIYARQLGPVVNSISAELKPYHKNPIIKEFNEQKDITDERFLYVLEFVYKNVAQYSAFKLVDFTHSEEPWRKTKTGEVIKEDLIRNYFRDTYIDNFNENNDLNIKKEEILSTTYKNILNTYLPAFKELAK